MKNRTHNSREEALNRSLKHQKALLVSYTVLLVFYVGVTVAAFTPFLGNDPFAGGWEVTSSLQSLTVADTEVQRPGLHTTTFDPDGDFVAGQGIYPGPYNKPGVTIETSYPYWIRQSITQGWVESDEAVILDKYNITLQNDAEERRVQQYFHWTVAVDVTIKTDATKYYKPQLSYLDYGYWYENDVVDISTRVNFALSPWVASGNSGNWTIVGGWNGIMSASVVSVQSGLIEQASENYGHTIQNTHSEGAALNMYLDESATAAQNVDFVNHVALDGIPQAIETELTARLGAGADYKTDLLGHVYDIAVRNVFVEYTVRFDVLSTVIWSLRLGHQGGMDPPDENNTSYSPSFSAWDELFEAWRQFFYSPGFTFVFIVLVVAGTVILVIIIRRRT